MDKRAVRNEVWAALKAMRPLRRAFEEDLVQAAVQAEPAWSQARTVLLYHAVAPEFSVAALAHAAWRDGKTVAFPRVTQDGLALHRVAGWRDLDAGFKGIPEPRPGAPTVAPGDIDLAIVPGVAFTRDGARLGRGGGHYDRLIPTLRAAWGIAFDGQLRDALPRDPWDADVHRVVTRETLGLPEPT